MNLKSQISDWWTSNPMTYGETHGENRYGGEETVIGSECFFAKADDQFYRWNKNLHIGNKKFTKIFPYSEFVGLPILEIGCGLGCMAYNWAKNGAQVNAVDLSQNSIEMTKRRFELAQLPISLHIADANHLPFQDNTFSYVYSWGVLHHSPNIGQSIAEMFRILKPGGRFGVMLYNRNSLLNWYRIRYTEGFLHEESHYLDELQLSSRYTDGHREEGNPYTILLSPKEMEAIFSKYSSDVSHKIFGTDLDPIFIHLLPGLGFFLPLRIKRAWARRFGWSVWLHGSKG